eukprot:CAMPEP_0171895070 /NCGR_PEP_ID=MMETSP0992-20121227/46812_1 /TAXON_ID=483369 /ORGANISM="non described non described, Strain CCMP2098" /LENGTH=53 /DNA_ID=CAMNT_0012522919 /DNA_START=117 /DNA_END=275 /DNA_ORIENTATION=-
MTAAAATCDLFGGPLRARGLSRSGSRAGPPPRSSSRLAQGPPESPRSALFPAR